MLYSRLKKIPFTFAVTSFTEEDEQIENVVPYHSNFIIFNCSNLEEFEKALRKTITLPYWHPLANIILNYQAPYNKDEVAKLFYIFWYYRAINVIVVQHNIVSEEILISYFSPYICENYKLDHLFGCWTTYKIGMPIENFKDSFQCVRGCHNVTLYSKLRSTFLGTCIGFNTAILPFTNWSKIQDIILFEDKSKDLHGYTFLAYIVEVLPFLGIQEEGNGTYKMIYRDGLLWNTMAELFNFKIDLFPSKHTMKGNYDFEINIQQVFSFTLRKADLILFPLYQFDLITAEVDYTVPFVDSGVCVMSQRADYETIVFNEKFIKNNMFVMMEQITCFFCTWFVFFLFNTEQLGRLSLDQAGKDFINAYKTVMSISLNNPPRRDSFRIFFTIAIWGFFVVNFTTQASIISLFSVHKRGKEVDTFDDVIEKGYKIEGIASPDVVLPDTEKKFQIITSRMEVVHDLFGCVKQMPNDSHRFCLIDCTVGRYLANKMLNEKGEQFLHIATEARIHSHYLNMILHKDSPLTDRYNKYMMALFEAGLIKKWMDFRYFDPSEEVPIKPLGMEDLGGIFHFFCVSVGICIVVFIIEILFYSILWAKRNYKLILKRLRDLLKCKRKLNIKYFLGKLKLVKSIQKRNEN